MRQGTYFLLKEASDIREHCCHEWGILGLQQCSGSICQINIQIMVGPKAEEGLEHTG